jgi:FkbH-like protein
MTLDWREDIEARFSEGSTRAAAWRDFGQRVRRDRALGDLLFGNRLLLTLSPEARAAVLPRPLRVSLLTSWTSDFLDPLLRADFAIDGIDAALHRSHFNQFRQEILNPASSLYQFSPEVTVVAFRLEDVFPSRLAQLSRADEALDSAFADEFAHFVLGLIDAWRLHSKGGALLLADLLPPWGGWSPLSPSQGWEGRVARLNERLEGLAGERPGVYVFGLARLAAERGRERWVDPRLLHTARIPVGREHWPALSDALVRHAKACRGLGAKCLVTDLDGTLWGGVLGEDGPAGLQLGEGWPGSLYRDVQSHLLDLAGAGVVLAVSSKNRGEDVASILASHPGMILRDHHFAAVRADWREKTENLREIAQEISLGLDQIVFIDDNPVEIARVQSAIPEITCLRIETPPVRFAEQLRSLRLFDRFTVTEEDRGRGEFYAREKQRRELKAGASTLDEFFKGLGQRLTVFENHAPHLARIAQLSQRTNQFNMTTIRLSEDDAFRLLGSSDHILLTASLTDRLGDSGIVGYAQVRRTADTWLIENLLMSCRVLGRGVEQNLVEEIALRAMRAGASVLTAEYVGTAKNAPFADFYHRCGFVAVEEGPRRFFRREPSQHGETPGQVEVIAHES